MTSHQVRNKETEEKFRQVQLWVNDECHWGYLQATGNLKAAIPLKSLPTSNREGLKCSEEGQGMLA